MPIPPCDDPPLSFFGPALPLAALPDDAPHAQDALWPVASAPVSDLRTQCSPLLFGGGVFGSGMYNDDAVLQGDAAVRALRLAFRYGINALDSSPYYYPSEFVLGRALRILTPEHPRSSYFLISKCGRYGPMRSMFDYAPERILRSIHESLRRLGTSYLDAALLHDAEFVSDQPPVALSADGAYLAAQAVDAPCADLVQRSAQDAQALLGLAPGDAARIRGPGDERVLRAVQALFALKDQGVVRNVGISGYPLGELTRLSRLVASQPPYRPLDVILSYSSHTLHSDLLPAWRVLLAVCPPGREATWTPPMLLNASPFSMGLLSDRGAPPWHPADPALAEATRAVHAQLRERARADACAPITPDNVLGRTALFCGIQGLEGPGSPPLRTLVGMSSVEEVHAAVATYRILAHGTRLGAPESRTYEQLSTYAALSPYAPLAAPPSASRPLHVVVACTGSVASVKVPLIVDALMAYSNVLVYVVTTAHALHFFDRLTAERPCDAHYTTADLAAANKAAQAASLGDGGAPSPCRSPRVRVWEDADEWAAWKSLGDPVLHIELRRWADVVLVAPCSANTLAKVSHGLCDNLLTSFLRALSPTTPTWLFPAMNTLMYMHPMTARQLDVVRNELGYEVFGPISKCLACGDVGDGAMLEWTDIVKLVVDRFGLVCGP
ncbi:D-arabinose 1-dehydrogenase (NAD(+)) [Malassezia sp. CBS 17886]|nr:D-arabinose 1-dehydrogenase (NAD(+)) [Malassezia sp. CBS 17886]